ncbi:MAG: AraC family transcriptional regulator [Chitinophagales bacterium]
MKLLVKYLLSQVSLISVEEELNKLGFHPGHINLSIDIKEDISHDQHKQIKMALRKGGLELLDDKKGRLIEKIKKIIIDMVHDADEPLKTNFSSYLSEKLSYNYTYLANIFSEGTGTTIEHFLIIQKIERAKQLINQHKVNLTEIAFQLHYSSVAHLSNQFKKITGLTPSFFKSLKKKTHYSISKGVNPIILLPGFTKSVLDII